MLTRPPTPPPRRPGCYIFRDAKKKPLYVGKAKDLHARVSSYFAAKAPPRIIRLRKAAVALEYIVTATEWEAFLLENNLIKQFKPRFNTLLKDDKSYPYIKLTVGDRYPKALFTRNPVKDGSLYYGPFVPGGHARRNLRILQETFRLATCKDPLDGTRARPCLRYEMGHCPAPCVKGKIDTKSYARIVEEARLFLEGRTEALLSILEERMKEAASRREYELAAQYRDLRKAAEALGARQSVARIGQGWWDFYSLYGEGEDYVLHGFVVMDGKVVDRKRWRFTEVELEAGELLSSALTRLYANATALPDGVAVSTLPGDLSLLARFLSGKKGRSVPVVLPKRGPKAALIKTLAENARLDYETEVDPKVVLKPITAALGLSRLPRRIECFDVSHTAGEATVASCVVWRGGAMVRAQTRTFTVKTVDGVDDFAAVAEVVGRRYARVLREEGELPDLVLIDGGLGQVNAAHNALTALLPETPPIAGIAKREELLFTPDRPEPIVLPENSPALRLLRHIRDEAHRVAVTRHRKRRSKGRFESRLLQVPGVGPVTARKLLRAFLTTEAVKAAPEEALVEAVGKRAATAVLAWARGGGAGERA